MIFLITSSWISGSLTMPFFPIKGPEGNIEYLIYLQKREDLPEEITALTENEAECALREILENGVSGITAVNGTDGISESRDETLESVVSAAVAQAHQMLE